LKQLITVYLRWGLSCAGVWGDVVRAAEDLESWVALNAIALAEFGLFCTVNLGKLDVLLLQCGRSLFVLGGKRFAVATIEIISNLVSNGLSSSLLRGYLPPWCEEFCKNQIVVFDEIWECVLSKRRDI